MRRLRPVQKYPIPTEITATHDWDVNHEGFEFCGFYTRAPGSDHEMMPKTYPIGPQLISDWFLSNVRRRSVLWISFLGCCREIMASDATYQLRLSSRSLNSQTFLKFYVSPIRVYHVSWAPTLGSPVRGTVRNLRSSVLCTNFYLDTLLHPL